MLAAQTLSNKSPFQKVFFPMKDRQTSEKKNATTNFHLKKNFQISKSRLRVIELNKDKCEVVTALIQNVSLTAVEKPENWLIKSSFFHC